MTKAKALLSAVTRLHGAPHDFDGVTLNVVREVETGRILSIHVTPVDAIDGEPVPRYVSAQEAVSH